MAFIHGKNAVVLHGAYALTSFLNDGSVSSSIETAETTSFGNSAKTFVTGNAKPLCRMCWKKPPRPTASI